ncbi:hypothetical protein Sango_1573600 [Sesamum angolense]|uniref:DUF4283 domain-containing protein n=1 Tax=Sesamum angolense TaxID=2727404 RepID=A0AAE2BTU4_9LAMI|nr:hypothetical protein Sango_1573600 [Sesamum angolense]
MGATEFEGTSNPKVAERWWEKTKDVMNLINCTLENRLKDDQTVAAYELRFAALAKYAPEAVGTQEDCCYRFEKAYNLRLREPGGLKVKVVWGVVGRGIERGKGTNNRYGSHTIGRGTGGVGPQVTPGHTPARIYHMTREETPASSDVISGMDWLAQNKAVVDCYKKEIVIESSGEPRVVFVGDRQVMPICEISAIQARRLMLEGCEAYLANMIDTRMDRPTLQEIPIVVFLGHVIFGDGVMHDPTKVKIVERGSQVEGLVKPRQSWFKMESNLERLKQTLVLTEDEEAEHINISYSADQSMDVNLLGDHRFLICFNHMADRDMALRSCPWAFDRNLVILATVKDEENPMSVQLNWCLFYVHVHGLLLQWMTSKIVESIGNRMGQFLEYDNSNS